MTGKLEHLTYRSPRVGDYVTIHNPLCYWDDHSGEIIGISETDKEMPIMVQRANYDTWPFAVSELELHSLDDEVYEGGWIDPRLEVRP